MYDAQRTAGAAKAAVFFLLLVLCPGALAQVPAMAGSWIINEDLSDDTDRRVEAALRAAGRPVRRSLFDSREDRYRGGPEEQELYDHISYDDTLRIELGEPEYTFTYDGGYTRPVYTDDRQRSVSLSNLDAVEDFSLAYWEEERLLVEARPRDGGFTQETYTLVDAPEGGRRLRAELYIHPRVFEEPIEIVRIYDPAPSGEDE